MQITAAQLKTFIDWTETDATHYLSERFGRGPERNLITDHIGFLRYYDRHWGLRLIPADFLGVLAASDGSQVVVALSAGNPVSMAAQFVGGALDGLSVDSKMVIWVDGSGNPDIDVPFGRLLPIRLADCSSNFWIGDDPTGI
jgi:hypothetical protein